MKNTNTATIKSIVDEGNWIRCGQCRHKLLKILNPTSGIGVSPMFEMKCHSCKTMNIWWYNEKDFSRKGADKE